MQETSSFNTVSPAPADEIFKLAAAFKEDPRPFKVDLSVGIYRDNSLQTPIFKAVKQAEQKLLVEETTKHYLPIQGDPDYLEESGKLLLGEKRWKEHRTRICGLQTVGGTGGLYLGGAFLLQEISARAALPEPTWPNHRHIFKQCGFSVHTYPYPTGEGGDSAFETLLTGLRALPRRTVVLLHAACHNPTGFTLTAQRWEEVIRVLQEKEHIPFFDSAYQGLGNGLEEDVYPLLRGLEKGLNSVVASSYSKNMGLYSERVGTLYLFTSNERAAQNVLSKLKRLARTFYSNPPRHGAAVVRTILTTPALRTTWLEELHGMRHRLQEIRELFAKALAEAGFPRDVTFLRCQRGMFCFLDLKPEEVHRLQVQEALYLAPGGRVNLAGLSPHNMPHVLQALRKTWMS